MVLMSLPRRLLTAILLVGGLTALTACGPGATQTGNGAQAKSSVEYLIDYMRDWYLWYAKLPQDIDPASYPSPADALAALRVPEDRFSYIDDATTYDAFFESGRTVGFGIVYGLESSRLVLRVVQPASPAGRAGLRRADRVVSIDGTSVATLLAQNGLDTAFGASEPGVTVRFGIERNGVASEIAVTKDWYDLSYVLDYRTIDVGGRTVGYVSLFAFADPAPQAWRSAIGALAAAGASDLVVDLRDNGGGRLQAAAEIGSALGNGPLAGLTMATLEFNDRHPEANRSIAFVDDGFAGRFDRIIWLTSSSTCSASEALMVGLQSFRTATRIGTMTCGKPVGFTPPTYAGLVYSIVSFRSVNADGFGQYDAGLAPDCAVSDPVNHALGDPAEPLLAAAIGYLGGAGCPASAANSSVKSLAGEAWRHRHGMARITGLI